jgi:glycosyltransferase involved in cell wall biosynthesis
MSVSIIIPVYNVSACIERCLLSVMNQTFPDIEYILVNDATPDNSMEKVAGILNNYPGKEVKIIHHLENKGLAAARNTGVKVATGDYVFFLDSDDEIVPDCIETLVTLTDNRTVDFVVGEIRIVGGKQKNFPQLLLQKGTYSGTDFIFTSFLNRKWYEMVWNKLIKRSIFTEKNVWFEEGIVHEDTLWSFQFALAARTMVVTHVPTYYYHIQNNSITQNKSVKNIASFYIVLEKIIRLSCRENLFASCRELPAYLERQRIYFIKSLLRGNFDRPYIREQRNRINQLYKNSVWNKAKRNPEFILKDFILSIMEFARVR